MVIIGHPAAAEHGQLPTRPGSKEAALVQRLNLYVEAKVRLPLVVKVLRNGVEEWRRRAVRINQPAQPRPSRVQDCERGASLCRVEVCGWVGAIAQISLQPLRDQAPGCRRAGPSLLARGSRERRAVDCLAEGQAQVATVRCGEGSGFEVEADPFAVTKRPGMDLSPARRVRRQALEQ